MQEALQEMEDAFLVSNDVDIFFDSNKDALQEAIEQHWDTRPDLVQKLRESEQVAFDAVLTPELRFILR